MKNAHKVLPIEETMRPSVAPGPKRRFQRSHNDLCNAAGSDCKACLFNMLVPSADDSGRATIFATLWGAIARFVVQNSAAKLTLAIESPVRLL